VFTSVTVGKKRKYSPIVSIKLPEPKLFIQLRGMQKNFQLIGKFMMFRVKSEIHICIYIGTVITS